MKKAIALVCILIFILPFAPAAENERTDENTNDDKDKPEVVHIDPYIRGEEPPSWAKNLRRSEIVTLGSLPFTALGVTLAYSLYRYGANDFNPAYIPNPFPLSSAEAKLSTTEQVGIIGTAAALSVAVGLTDFIVLQVKAARQKKNVQKIREEQSSFIRIAEDENAEQPQSTQAVQNDSDVRQNTTAVHIQQDDENRDKEHAVTGGANGGSE